MEIYVNVKQAGSRRYGLSHVPYEIAFDKGRLAELIAAFTAGELQRYQMMQDIKQHNALLLGADTRMEDDRIRELQQTRSKAVDPVEAVRVALEGYADGLVRILQNDVELTDLEQEVTVREGDVFTFIRLTFLAGRMW